MDLFKQNYINSQGFCHKKKTWYVFHYIFPLLVWYLLVRHTNSSFCASPECLVGYDAGKMPRPHNASGLCGRHCKYSWICDPCQILNSTAADEIDEMLFVVEPPNSICRNVSKYRVSLAIVNRMNSGKGTSQAKTFATSLRKYEWNFETGSCGNNVVIFLSRYDRQIYTSAGEAAFRVLNEKCITGIYKEAKEDYFLSDDFEGGLKFMVQEYKKALEEGQCSYGLLKTWEIELIASIPFIGFLYMVGYMACMAKICPSDDSSSSGGWEGGEGEEEADVVVGEVEEEEEEEAVVGVVVVNQLRFRSRILISLSGVQMQPSTIK